jgi:hypothetical protein
MMLSNELWASTEASLELVPKVELSLAYVHIASWSYAPPESSICTTTTGCVTPRRLDSATTYHAIGWLTSSVSMSWLDELSVSFGYYNQAGQLGPDGRRRNPLWSPDARIFLTLTANLDAIYERVAGGGAREASSE